MNVCVVEVATAAGMRALGARVAQLLQAGDLVVLSGPLGAGKTVLAQGIGRGLGTSGPVTSPTFVLARVHRGGRLPLVHVDAYRLGAGPAGRAELDDLDLDANLDASVVVVEWGEGLVEGLAEARLEAYIDRPTGSAGEGAETRRLTLRGIGARWAGVDLRRVAAGTAGGRPSATGPPPAGAPPENLRGNPAP